ncbi:MAG: glycosyltransferase family 2 protein, partial [Actinomycetes bacterium]
MNTDRAGRSVGLVVPIYDMEEHLAECLASIEAQTIFAEMQVVLVDDGSTDGSPRIVAAFAARHDNVVLLREPNRGPGAARNRGLREVATPFVAFCDSDDRLPPDAMATLRGILLEHDADVAVGALETFPRHRQWPWFEHLDADSRLVPG